MTLMLHTPAPDFSLVAVRGQEISLRDQIQSGQHTLLVFLRHLG